MSETLTAINQLKQQMQLSVLGQEHVVDSLIITMLVNGNLLLEGLPGTAKTRSIKTMASVLEADLGRIQFTADLLPSDVTGTEIFQEVDGKQLLTFQQGQFLTTWCWRMRSIVRRPKCRAHYWKQWKSAR